jgi:hypothetical protein
MPAIVALMVDQNEFEGDESFENDTTDIQMIFIIRADTRLRLDRFDIIQSHFES